MKPFYFSFEVEWSNLRDDTDILLFLFCKCVCDAMYFFPRFNNLIKLAVIDHDISTSPSKKNKTKN